MTPPRFSGLLLPAVFALLVSGILAGGHLRYLALKQKIQGDCQETLAFIADLKARQITQWMEQWRRQAEVLRADRLLAKEARGGGGRDLRAYLEAFQQHQEYRSILLLDLNGTVTLAVGEEELALDDTALRLAAEAAARDCVMVSDFRRVEKSRIHLDAIETS